MYKLFKLFPLITILFFSCSNDDSIDSSLLVSHYIEPNLQFCISQQELIDIEGEPDVIKPFVGTLLYYNNPQNGVKEIRYLIEKPIYKDSYFYTNSNVELFPNQKNFDYILNWLTNKYGTPEIIEVVPYFDTYYWITSNYDVKLNISNDNDDRLFIAYVNSCD